MNQYQLIAFDMDGTLLTPEKQISERTVAAIGRAFDAGKDVVLATGRCIPELEEHFARVPRLRYAVCESGAMVYDVRERRVLHSHAIPIETVRRILAVCKATAPAPMVHLLDERSIVESGCVPRMADFGMGVYRTMFEQVTKQVDDIFAWYDEYPVPLEKVNIYHTSPQGRERTRALLKELPLVLVDAEQTSLECSAAGVSKGTGLSWLCKHLGIPLETVIAVGDADNDLAMLRTVGLPLAMGNANAAVKSVAAATLPANDQDGCAAAIETYLLGE